MQLHNQEPTFTNEKSSDESEHMTEMKNKYVPDGNHPAQIGAYDILGILGTGNAAVVYDGYNRSLKLSRAIKLMKTEKSPQAYSQFEYEINVSAKLKHPHIVKFYSSGEWKGLPYLELEKLEGVTLEKILTEKTDIPFSVMTAVAIMVCRALVHAHTSGKQTFLGYTYHGIVHNNIKPSDIMLLNSGIVKLIDFGIAKPMNGIGKKNTGDNLTMDTIHYIAPEQIDGLYVDFRTDIFSLGVVLYEMITGHKAFPGSSVQDVLEARKNGAVASILSLRPQTPKPVCSLIEHCMEPDRLYRMPSASDLLIQLETVHKRLTSDTDPVDVVKSFLADEDAVFLNPPEFSPRKTTMLLVADVLRSVKPSVERRTIIRGTAIGAGILCFVCLLFWLFSGGWSMLRELQSTVFSSTTALIQNMAPRSAKPQPAPNSAPEETPRSVVEAPQTSRSSNMPEPSRTAAPPKEKIRKSSGVPENLKPDIVTNKITTKDGTPGRKNPSTQKYSNTETPAEDQNWRELYMAEPAPPVPEQPATAPEPAKEPEEISDESFLRLLRLSMQQNSIDELGNLLSQMQIDDGEYYLYWARYKLSRNELSQIESIFKKAQSAPCKGMTPEKMGTELMYLRARYRSQVFNNTQKESDANAAMEAWYSVKYQFRGTPGNAYYTEADIEIRRISVILHGMKK